MPYIDILIFALIGAFLIFRLVSVLGQRTGEERQRPNPFERRDLPPGAAKAPGNVVPLPTRGNGAEAAPEPDDQAHAMDEGGSLEAGLAQVRMADPNFDERGFLRGAKAAYEMIVPAAAAGDTPTLRPLLSDDLYDGYAEAIRRRQAAGQTQEAYAQVEDADIVRAGVQGRTAVLAVQIRAKRGEVTRDRDGAVVAGDPEALREVEEVWTFSRNTRSTDPNWQLTETRTL
ncbi:MAG TPA: Tim44/TimA family putative adaptor protein [Alphaproteobacteria bacterium]|nr:Tim44/TimA family putative adaptor protein [Alphaproteobacteria bacterium]